MTFSIELIDKTKRKITRPRPTFVLPMEFQKILTIILLHFCFVSFELSLVASQVVLAPEGQAQPATIVTATAPEGQAQGSTLFIVTAPAPEAGTGTGTAPVVTAPGARTGTGTTPVVTAPGAGTGTGATPVVTAPGAGTGTGTGTVPVVTAPGAGTGTGTATVPGAAPGPSKRTKRRLLLIILVSIATLIFIVGFLLFLFWMRMYNSKAKISKSAQDFDRNHSNLRVFSLEEIKLASNGFSIENKLGEGGYGPVYKGVFPNGLEIAVKKLSKSSTQGFEELKNEIDLTARLQHVNLVKVLGFCIEGDEKLLIYEYMPNKSLDNYLFDPIRRRVLDWRKRINIIEGVTQGLLYLQEYSRLTIIHRDLKPSNILLDNEMNPKISDFGMARIFAKDALEANTDRVVGTYGYIPPEYVRQGIYSMKSDVYSFGVLLLQIISGQRNAHIYGPNEDLSLLDYAYELWKDGKGMEFMDPVFDDTLSLRKSMRCMQIALLCVQKNANDRPSMLEVSSMLKNENAAMGIPKKPAFSTRNADHNQESDATPLLNIGSVDKATITEMVAR